MGLPFWMPDAPTASHRWDGLTHLIGSEPLALPIGRAGCCILCWQSAGDDKYGVALLLQGRQEGAHVEVG